MDVVVIGAGPVGLAQACLLKALNKSANICILDKRRTISRDYGIAIGRDAVKTINTTLDRALKSSDFRGDQLFAGELKHIFSDWSRHSSIRTNQIQRQLTEMAEKMGITILKGPEYEVTEENLSPLLSRSGLDTTALSPELQQLRSSIAQARVVVGADSAHSAVRKRVMGADINNLTDEQAYGYILEIKHEMATDSDRRPGMKHLKEVSSYEGMMLVETIGRPNPHTNLLPVTDLIHVDKDVYDAFLERDAQNEIIRGSPGKGWSLEELQEKAKTNPIIKDYLRKINKQIREVRLICNANLNVSVKPPAIAVLPLAVYRSKQIVKIFEDRVIALVGDASSGLVIRRGFNKGLKEAAFSAEAIDQYLSQPNGDLEPFMRYQEQAHKLFANETWHIALKVKAINVLKWLLNTFVVPIYRPLRNLVKYS